MPDPTMQTVQIERLRPGHGARRSELQRVLLGWTSAPAESAVVRERFSVYERVTADLRQVGLERALERAAACYRRVPLVPQRLRTRHPLAHARGQAFERVFEAAGVDAGQVERLRRVRPRFVDEPQAAS